MRSLLRVLAVVLVVACAATAQLPRQFYAWWNSPVARDLNLSDYQKRQIRNVIQNFRPHLQNLRASVGKAEDDLEEEFNRDPVNPEHASEVIARLAAARSDLTRTLSEMSLQLRTVLTREQWRQLQMRRPATDKQPNAPDATSSRP